MLTTIIDRTGEIADAVRQATQEAVSMITVNVANYSGQSTGALAGSLRADDNNEIGSDLPYARFVFTGAGHGPAQPPDVPTEQIQALLAQRIHDVLFP